MIQRYRTKPVVIEAVEYTGSPQSNRQIIDWTRGSNTPASMGKRVTALKDGSFLEDTENRLRVATLEGSVFVAPGDFVVRGFDGEFYPCKPETFHKTYEPAEDAPLSYDEKIETDVSDDLTVISWPPSKIHEPFELRIDCHDECGPWYVSDRLTLEQAEVLRRALTDHIDRFAVEDGQCDCSTEAGK